MSRIINRRRSQNTSYHLRRTSLMVEGLERRSLLSIDTSLFFNLLAGSSSFSTSLSQGTSSPGPINLSRTIQGAGRGFTALASTEGSSTFEPRGEAGGAETDSGGFEMHNQARVEKNDFGPDAYGFAGTTWTFQTSETGILHLNYDYRTNSTAAGLSAQVYVGDLDTGARTLYTTLASNSLGSLDLNVDSSHYIQVYAYSGGGFPGGNYSVPEPIETDTRGVFSWDFQVTSDIIVTKMERSPDDGGMDLYYSIEGGDIPTSWTLGLYWAGGTERSDILSEDSYVFLASIVSEAGREGDHGPLHVPGRALRYFPEGATNLLLIADLENKIGEVEEKNNLLSVDFTDIAPMGLDWDHESGGVEVRYGIAGTLPLDSNIDLYWASGETLESIIPDADGKIRPAESIPAGRTAGYYGPLNISASAISTPPKGAKYLLAVADPQFQIAEFNEDNNVLAVEIQRTADIEVESLEWDFDQGGVSLTYEIKNADLTGITDISLFWSNGNSISGGQTFSMAAPIRSTEVSVGPHTVHIPASAFSVPPSGTTHLVAYLDHSKTIEESDESNLSNEAARVLVVQPPTVRLSVDTESPMMDQDYKVTAHITNNGPVPFSFSLNSVAVDLKPNDLLTVPGQTTVTTGEVGVGFHETRDVSLGSFNSTWQWIPRENPVGDDKFIGDLQSSTLTEFVKANGSKLVNRLISIKEYLDAIKLVHAAEYDGKMNLTVNVKDTSGPFVDVGADQTVELAADREKILHYGLFNTSVVTSGEYMGRAILAAMAALAEPTKVSLPVLSASIVGDVAASLAARKVAKIQYDQAADPPDDNYTQLASPEPLSFPEIEGLPPGPFKDLATTSLGLQAVLAAAATSRDRAAGAELAGDDYWQSRQLIAAAGFATEAAAIETRLAAINTQILPFVTTTLVPHRDEVAPYLEANGLPDPVVSLLTRFGFSAEQVEDVRRFVIAAAKEVTSDPGFVPIAQKSSALILASISNLDLERAIKIRVDQLGQSVRDLDPTEREALDSERADIESGLEQGIPTDSLRSSIITFLDHVEGLIQETNNPPALQQDLDFGYASLADFQQLIVAPPTVQTVVNDGSAQRSMVTSLTVTFDGPVTLDPGAFEVRSKDGRSIGLNLTTSLVDGRTVVVLTFTGSDIIAGSLADGEYTLTVLGDKIHDAQSQALDGDLDGVLGGDRVDAFFRLFGDTDGDGDVDNLDFFRVREAVGKRAGEEGYFAFLDFDGDGNIDRTTDFVEVAKRRGKRFGL